MRTTFKSVNKFVAAALFIVLCASVQAQVNVLDNPGFDTDLSGWEIFEDRVGDWSPEDVDGSSSSGSALLSNVGQSTGNIPLVLHQCMPVDAGVQYIFGGDLMVPEGEPTGTNAFIFAQTFASDDCSGTHTQVKQVFDLQGGVWNPAGTDITAAPNVLSARIGLGVFKPVGATADAKAHYDNVYFEPPGDIYLNESMSASWFNPDESGHGIMIHLNSSSTAWMCWFTFDNDGNPAWICSLGEFLNNTITFENAITVEGGAFPPNFDPNLIVEVPWGSIVVEFTSCDTGTMTWVTEAPGFQSGEMPIIRLTNLWGATCP